MSPQEERQAVVRESSVLARWRGGTVLRLARWRERCSREEEEASPGHVEGQVLQGGGGLAGGGQQPREVVGHHAALGQLQSGVGGRCMHHWRQSLHCFGVFKDYPNDFIPIIIKVLQNTSKGSTK